MNFDTVKSNYTNGLWSEAMVRIAVRKGIITKEQFELIVNKPY